MADSNGIYATDVMVTSVDPCQVDIDENPIYDSRYRCTEAPTFVGAFRFRCAVEINLAPEVDGGRPGPWGGRVSAA